MPISGLPAVAQPLVGLPGTGKRYGVTRGRSPSASQNATSGAFGPHLFGAGFRWPICGRDAERERRNAELPAVMHKSMPTRRSEEHTSELQSLRHLVCRLLL